MQMCVKGKGLNFHHISQEREWCAGSQPSGSPLACRWCHPVVTGGGCLQSADHKCITVQINVTMCNAFTLSLNREFKLQVPLASGGPVSPKGKCLAQPLLLKTNQPSLQYASANACHCSKRSLIQQLKQNRMWIIN